MKMKATVEILTSEKREYGLYLLFVVNFDGEKYFGVFVKGENSACGIISNEEVEAREGFERISGAQVSALTLEDVLRDMSAEKIF